MEANYGDMGWALSQLRQGHRVMRRGWNGKGMWLRYVPHQGATIPHKFTDGLPVKEHIVMKTVDNELVPWLASQTDLLAQDWQLSP